MQIMLSVVGIVKINKTQCLPSGILLSSKRRLVSGLVSINVISDREKACCPENTDWRFSQ